MSITKSRKATNRVAKKPRKDANRVITDAVLDELRNGVAPWRRPWVRTGGVPVNLSTGNAYRGVNVLAFMLSGWGDRHWITYKQADTLGGQVRKGEHGTPGLRWLESERRIGQGQVAALIKRGERIQYDEQGPYVVRVGWTLFTAFNVLQVDGLELPSVPPITWDPDARAEEVLHGYTGGPQIIERGDSAQYRHGGDTVYVPDRGRFDDAGAYYHAAFHELVHSTGIPSRLDRKMGEEFGTRDYAVEELTAEIGAAILCAEVGLVPPIENSAAYIASWLKRLEDDHRLVIPAGQAAQKAVDLILARSR